MTGQTPRGRWARAATAGGALAVAAAAVAGCTSPATHSAEPSTGPSVASNPSGASAVRWWSNGAVGSGSAVDPANPAAAAAQLSPSAEQYCAMLRQTVAAGKSVLSDVTANDPALLASTKAFIAEIEAVAPPSVAGPWRVLGPAVLTLVDSGGDSTKVKGIDAAAVRKAATAVAADAKHSCGVDLDLS